MDEIMTKNQSNGPCCPDCWEALADRLELLFPDGVPDTAEGLRDALTAHGGKEARLFLGMPEKMLNSVCLTALQRMIGRFTAADDVANALVVGRTRSGKSAWLLGFEQVGRHGGIWV